ncbi:hypothetical protein [Pedobacter yulinensis]|uniref:hypothetical protein n=1 Tax=Pedobacter yulinensis TaxID=2126353 RepID=UPI0013A6667A|nr:hypothetical protein [Pedobacter yulinensis]
MGTLFDFPVEIVLADKNTLFDLFAVFYEDFKRSALRRPAAGAYIHLLVTRLRELVRSVGPHLHGTSHLVQQYKSLVNEHFHQ